MYEKSFQMLINSAAPYAKEMKGKLEKGIKLVGIVSTDSSDLLDDIEITAAGKDGLVQICSGKLPIEGEIGLKFAKRRDLAVQLGDLPLEKVSIKKIGLRTPGDVRKFDIKLTMLIPNVKQRTAARVYEKFKEFEQVKISQTQLDLPLAERKASSKTVRGRRGAQIPGGLDHAA
jgi:hypothetical protein